MALLRFYKVAVSPMLGDRCRFYPSCSDYAREAIQYHGAARGSMLAARRLCRCHPFSAGGIDLVPMPERAKDRAQEHEPGSDRVQDSSNDPASVNLANSAKSADSANSNSRGANKAPLDRH